MQKNIDELNPTTVRLTEKAQLIKEDLAPIFGLKNILSAGLTLLSKLSDTEQKRAIAFATEKDPAALLEFAIQLILLRDKTPTEAFDLIQKIQARLDADAAERAVEVHKHKKQVHPSKAG